jgi:hypothetical protein
VRRELLSWALMLGGTTMTTAPTNNAQRRDDDPKISDFRTTV